jgi:hypothetical protein
MSFVLWLLCNAIGPCLSLFDCLEQWDYFSDALRESPRNDRGYQQDELWREGFG